MGPSLVHITLGRGRIGVDPNVSIESLGNVDSNEVGLSTLHHCIDAISDVSANLVTTTIERYADPIPFWTAVFRDVLGDENFGWPHLETFFLEVLEQTNPNTPRGWYTNTTRKSATAAACGR